MGLERTLAVLNGLDDDYQTEVFLPVIRQIEQLSGKSYQDDQKSFRVLADHIKAATFLLAEGLEPSNVERGYVLRRLIRRGIRYSRNLEIKTGFTQKISESVIEIYKERYPELVENKDFIFKELHKEEEKFNQTLEKGEKQFKKIAQEGDRISGEEAFDLYQTYGFPLEMTKELAGEHNLSVDEDGFHKELKQHQEKSRIAAGKFKSGLADHSEQTTKYHTATHLLLASLRKVLGENIEQKGSNITPERIRFDFSYPQKLTDDQIKQIEDLVNQKIKEDLPVSVEEMTLDEAKEKGVTGVFESKYGEKVKVYYVGDKSDPFSAEICAGPHMERTGDLGAFKIVKEESSSSGVRRVKAILE
jgi:alanyl-tRNA synthetase